MDIRGIDMRNITAALAGNPNTGKTSLFNNITGSRQHVGNWPGVTVEKREGNVTYKGKTIKIIDLPGIYSMGAYSEDEVIAREYILDEKPDVIVNVVDATNITRNLYLTVQLLEMDTDVIVALNMMDETEKLGINIDLEKLSKIIGIKIIPTVAIRSQGLENINKSILEGSWTKNKKIDKETSFKIDYGLKVEQKILKLKNLIKKDDEIEHKYPSRWLAIKLLEEDKKLIEQIKSLKNGLTIVEAARAYKEELEKDLNTSLDSYIISKRYDYIYGVVDQCVKVPKEDRLTITDKIDKVLTHKLGGIPCFIIIMLMVFVFTFTLSDPIVDLVEGGFEFLGEWVGNTLIGLKMSGIFTSFIVDGIIGGLGSVLGIVPVLFTLFIALAVLEDSGYMARIAYIMDKPMKRIGLHGKAFIPYLLGFGCNVPAIMSTRSLDNKRDRMVAIIANPFISCSARIPVFVLFTSVFFSSYQIPVVVSLYALSVITAIITTKLFGKLIPEEEDSSFIIELPPYRRPTLKGVFIHMWEKVDDFLKRVSTIILAAVIIVWLLSSLPFGVEYASDKSLVGRISSVIAPILKPAGFGTWQATIALIFGVLAKEVVVTTLGVVYKAGSQGLGAALTQHFTPLSAYSFMIMTLLYAPCIATIGSIKSETKSLKWTLIAILYGLVIAWVLSVLVYQIGLRLGLR
jgi:ferrous iron transport protein B